MTAAAVNFCPSCGAGLNDDLLILEAGETPVPAAGATTGPGSSRKPFLVIGALVIVLLLILQITHQAGKSRGSAPHSAVATTSPTATAAPSTVTSVGPTTTTTFVSGVSHTVLFVASPNAVERLDLDASTSRTYDLSAAGQTVMTQGADVGIAVLGDRVVIQQEGRTVALPASLIGPSAILGHSVGFVPSRQPGRVWLISVPTSGPVVQEVDIAGHPTSPPAALPADWQPMVAASGGLLLTSSLGFEVWDPVANRVGVRGPPQASVVASDGAQVAWQSSGCSTLCALHLTNLATGATALIYPQPPELLGNLQPGAFSPDGRFLAAGSYNFGGSVLLIIDLQTLRTEQVPAAGDGGGFTPTWSPSGQWIFVAGSSSNGTMSAYQRGTPSVQTVRVPPPASGPLTVAAVAP